MQRRCPVTVDCCVTNISLQRPSAAGPPLKPTSPEPHCGSSVNPEISSLLRHTGAQLTAGKFMMCRVDVIAHTDRPTEFPHLCSFIVSISHLKLLTFTLTALIGQLLLAAHFFEKALKTDSDIIDHLVNAVENLAAKRQTVELHQT